MPSDGRSRPQGNHLANLARLSTLSSKDNAMRVSDLVDYYELLQIQSQRGDGND
jgi:hypothetical protein